MGEARRRLRSEGERLAHVVGEVDGRAGRPDLPLHELAPVRRCSSTPPITNTSLSPAKAVAGDKDVFVMGGGQIIRQSVDAGLVDELVLHLSPVVLGAGTPLFVDAARRELVQRVIRPSSTAVHLTYDVR